MGFMENKERKTLLDLHSHTIYSMDGVSRLEEIKNHLLKLKKRKKNQLFIAITDHNTIKAHSIAKKLGMPFIPGVEITTEVGDVLLYFVEELPKTRAFEELLEIAKQRDYLAVLAHPFDKFRSNAKEEDVKKVEGIEVINAKCSEEENRIANYYAEKYKKLKTAGSDAHIFDRLFSAYVEVDEEVEKIEDSSHLRKLLRKAKPKQERGKRSFFEKAKITFKRIAKHLKL